ncbi:MAG: DNA-3-methyladenine glycosylase family protein, partial [Actinomycetota bacterium]
ALRRLLDLDADPETIDGTLSADPALRPLVRRTPGVRVPGAVDGLELAVRAVLGQQVTVRAARTLAGRLVERLGAPLDRPVGAVTHAFPSADRLAEAPEAGLGMPDGRARTIHRLAELVALGGLDLSGAADRDETLRRLADVPGVGPWTCAYVAMRALGDPDAFPAGDLGLRRGLERLGFEATPAAILARGERWRPWRAYAVMRLWLADHP